MQPRRACSFLFLFWSLILGLSLAACSGGPSSNPPGPVPLPPVPFRVETFVAQASFPVTIAFAPDGRLFYNELTTGNIRVVSNGQLLAQPFATLPVSTSGEQGLIGLAPDPSFSQNRFVYIYYTDRNALVGRVVRFTDQNNSGIDQRTVIDNLPFAQIHNGGNIGFGKDGRFYLTMGENGDPANSQSLTNANGTPNLRGKILRYSIDANGVATPAGTVPGAPSSPLFALGLRNSFDFTFHPAAGTVYASENGPNCDDEVNRITSQGNYGWRPDYPCADRDPQFVQPLVRFTPTIAPTGIMFYTGNLFTQWPGHLFLVAFNDGQIRRYVVDESQNGKITNSETVLTDPSGSLLDIVTGPDGNIYFSTRTSIRRIVRGP